MSPTARAQIVHDLDRLGGQRVLVVGDAMVDHYIWGTATRISPEAPVPVVRERERNSHPGGAANTAANVVALGVDAVLVAVVGDDADGHGLGQLLEATGVRPHLISAPDRPTTAKTRVMADTHQVARIDAEEHTRLPPAIEEELLAAVDSHLEEVDAVLISDYAKGTVSASIAARAIEVARLRDLPIVVDPKGPAFEKYKGATLITPNESEARLAAALAIDAEIDAVAACLGEVLPGTNLLITRGGAGMALYPPGGSRLDVPAQAQRVHDVTGAGDTVAAAIVVAIAGGIAISVAVQLANAAAAEAVQRVGVARITRDELRRALDDQDDAAATSTTDS